MKLYCQSPSWGRTNIYRQSPGFTGIVGEHSWSSFENHEYDYLLCNDPDNLPKALQFQPKEKLIFILQENPNVWIPDQDYLKKFGTIISPFSIQTPASTRLILAQPAIPWFYGIPFKTDSGLLHNPLQTKNELTAIEKKWPFQKKKLLSLITSGKASLPGHRWRLEIAQALHDHFGDAIDIFGFGHKPLADKAKGLDEYQFSVVIENENLDHYWTEKLADCVLGGCIPIYSGSAMAQAYLDWSFPTIPYGCNPKLFVEHTKMILEKHQYSQSIIAKARNKVLHGYNLLTYIPHLIKGGSRYM
jgi:hypothetical protein